MSLLTRLRGWFLENKFAGESLGRRGETAAAKFLMQLGYHILERGYDSPLGEIDIIAIDGKSVVFVEVKTRSSTDSGHPADAIDATKRRRMTQAALAYLKAHNLLQTPARFDVVAVTWRDAHEPPVIEHFKNAFAPVGSGQFFS
jgi:putative endonuclease